MGEREGGKQVLKRVLNLVAFHELKKIGLEAFLNLNDGEGWMLPETLKLADYRLGHDNRAFEPQRVAARLGERFLPWQLEGTPEESWEECERHAENLKQLLGDRMLVNSDQPQPEKNSNSPENPLPNPVQLNLFGNVAE